MNKTRVRQAIEIKGSSLTVVVLQIQTVDPDELYPQLIEKINKGRAFFANAPLLIDMSQVSFTDQREFDVARLVAMLRDMQLVPVAVKGADECLDEDFRQTNIGLLPGLRLGKPVELAVRQVEPAALQEEMTAEKEESSPPAPEEAQEAVVPLAVEEAVHDEALSDQALPANTVIEQPVRSGQRIVAPGNLVVLSSVNAGAEVLAVGDIHVYGALRGRAMAGIEGDETARIFAMQCNAELVSVAGEYIVNESLTGQITNQSVMITRGERGLRFTLLNL